MRLKNLHNNGMNISFSNAPLFKALLFMLCCFSLNTSFAQDCDNLTDGGAISGNESGCNNPTFDPSIITSITPATGGSGAIEYIWMQTTGDPNSPFNTWQIILGATDESYDPEPISQTTHYGRCSRRSGCSEYIGETDFVTKTISCCNFNAAITPLATSICPNETLSLLVTAMGTNLSYFWEASGGSFDNPSAANPNYTMMMPGTYSIRVTVSSPDCTEVVETTITVANPLSVSITANNNNVGINESVLLNSSVNDANVTYNWTATSGTFNDNTLANPTYSNSTSGDHQITLTVTNANGCTATSMFTISVQTCPLTITGVATEASCTGNDGTITITPTGATGTVSYQWSLTSIGNTSTPNGLAAGTYMVTATDEASCSATTTVTINSTSGLVLSPNIQLPACPGDNNGQITVTVTGGTPDFTYSWSNGLPNANVVSNLSAGTYSLTVTDADGCQATGTYQVDNPTPLILTGSSTAPACGSANGTATVSVVGGTPNYTYLWDDAAMQTTPTASNLIAGNYGVTVTDNNGCQNSIFITIDAGMANDIILTPTVTNANCGENNGAIDLAISGGTAPFSIQWDNGIGPIPNPTGLAAGIYTVIVTDVNGCSNNISVTISEIDGISIIIVSTPISCTFANDATAVAMVAGATGVVSFSWSSNLGNNAMVTELPAGTYTVTVMDDAGCSAVESVTIDSPTLLSAQTTSNSTDCTSSIGSATVVATGGTAPYTYLWNDVNNQTSQTATNLAPGDYQVTVTDFGGCTVSSSTTISANLGLMVTISTTNLLCDGGNTGSVTANVANGTPPFNYSWNNSLPNSPMLTGLIEGIYSVTVTDATGCFGIAEAKVSSPNALVVSPFVENASCNENDGRVRLDILGGTPDFTFAWGPPLTTNTMNFATNLAPGAYEYTVTDENGCMVADVVIVGQDPDCNTSCMVTAGVITTTDPTTICAGDGIPDPITVSLSGNSGDNSRWVITDESGNILGLPISNVINLDGEGFGTCFIWNITYQEGLIGLTNGGNLTNIVGCFELTNPITVIRQDCTPVTCNVTGGVITTMDNTTICAGDGIADNISVNLTGNIGANNQWIVTDEALNILELPSSNIFNFDDAGFGTCLIWNVSYTDAISGLIIGQNVNNFTGCFSLSNSIRVIRQDCQTDPCQAFNGSVVINNPSGTNVCAKTPVNLSTTPSNPFFTYSWTATGGSFDNATSPTPIYSMMMPGTYSIIATITNGTCVTRDTTEITIIAAPEIILFATNNTCGGENTGEIMATASSGTAPYTYAWSNGSTTASITNLAADAYTLTVTDANGCTAISTATISDGTDSW